MLNSRLSLGVLVGQVDYEYDDLPDYWEEGDGPGGQIDLRVYRSGRGLRGFYWGGGLGVWNTDYEWREDVGTGFETSGSGSSTDVELHFLIGGKIHFGDSGIFLDPSLKIGSWLDAGGDENDAGIYGFGSLSVGFAF